MVEEGEKWLVWGRFSFFSYHKYHLINLKRIYTLVERLLFKEVLLYLNTINVSVSP